MIKRMKRNKVYLQWGSAEEKDFIKYLMKNHYKKYENYINSINVKRNWGNINKHKIEDFICKLQKT